MKEYIYVLKDGIEVVYVGRSKNVENRVKQHKNKGFTAYEIIAEADKEKIKALEDAYIKMFDPIHNRQLNSDGWYLSLSKFSNSVSEKIALLRELNLMGEKPLFADNYRGSSLHYARQATKERWLNYDEGA